MTATFLFVAGTTGSILAFQHELDAAMNPHLFNSPTRGERLGPSELVVRVEQALIQVRVTSFFFATGPGNTVRLGVTARSGSEPLGYNQIFVDPASGAVLGTRQFGACCLERENLIPFIWTLHHSLYLPGPWGTWFMGAIALIWLIDCFIGFYLTLPAKPVRRDSGINRCSIWRRWQPAWAVKRNSSSFRFTFDLHRAGGLWLWALLLVLAVSSVTLNLTNEVARPVVSLLSPVTPSVFQTRTGLIDEDRPRLSFDQAFTVANAEAARKNWTAPARSLFHSASLGLFGVRFQRVGGPGLGQYWLYLDDVTGEILESSGIGEGSLGDAFLDIQLPLHGGSIAGLPGRILMAIAGIGVAMLSITGVLIWWRKTRSANRTSKAAP